MTNFEEGDFFGQGDYEPDNEYDDNENMDDGLVGAVVPVELMDRWKQNEMDLEFKRLNFTILQQAIQMLEKSFFWRWRTLSNRVKLLNDTYYVMLDLVSSTDSSRKP